ncbi:hypothetical protein Tco_0835754 [Tanacetum coccineum]
MSTRSNSSNLFSPLRDPESLIRRRNLGEPSSLFDFEEVMSIPHNNMGPPPAGPPPPNNNGPPLMVRPNGQAPRSMEELCQPSIDGRGGPIAPIPIQAMDFGLLFHDTTSNTIANPRGDVKAITTRSGVAYDGPSIPPTPSPFPKEVEGETEATKEHSAYYWHFILHFDISFTDALLHMPKFASTFKSLLSNKKKLFELANTPLNENCSAMLLKKFPEKLGDPDNFRSRNSLRPA